MLFRFYLLRRLRRANQLLLWMQKQHLCFSFTIEDMMEDAQSLYFRINTQIDHLGRENVRNIQSYASQSFLCN